MHLAQFNTGRFKGAEDDPRMVDFFANVERINMAAERMPGFVARVAGGENPWAGEAGVALNLSVWESAEALEAFVWQTVHAKIYNRKHEFFEKSKTPNLVMWWVDPGHIPTFVEAKARLDQLIANGPNEQAFGWAQLPSARLWQEKRCA